MFLLEILQRAELPLEQNLNLVPNLGFSVRSAPLVVVVERPELLQPVQRPALVISQDVLLEIAVDERAESLLQTVAVKPEEALQAVVVRVPRVLLRQAAKLLVHARVERAAEEVAPKPEERVHLFRVAGTQPLALVDAPLVERAILLLLEVVILQQRVRRVLKRGNVPRGAVVRPGRRPRHGRAAAAEARASLARRRAVQEPAPGVRPHGRPLARAPVDAAALGGRRAEQPPDVVAAAAAAAAAPLLERTGEEVRAAVAPRPAAIAERARAAERPAILPASRLLPGVASAAELALVKAQTLVDHGVGALAHATLAPALAARPAALRDDHQTMDVVVGDDVVAVILILARRARSRRARLPTLPLAVAEILVHLEHLKLILDVAGGGAALLLILLRDGRHGGLPAGGLRRPRVGRRRRRREIQLLHGHNRREGVDGGLRRGSTGESRGGRGDARRRHGRDAAALALRHHPRLPVAELAQAMAVRAANLLNLHNEGTLDRLEHHRGFRGHHANAVEAGDDGQRNPPVLVHPPAQEEVLAQILHREIVLHLLAHRGEQLIPARAGVAPAVGPTHRRAGKVHRRHASLRAVVSRRGVEPSERGRARVLIPAATAATAATAASPRLVRKLAPTASPRAPTAVPVAPAPAATAPATAPATLVLAVALALPAAALRGVPGVLPALPAGALLILLRLLLLATLGAVAALPARPLPVLAVRARRRAGRHGGKVRLFLVRVLGVAERRPRHGSRAGDGRRGLASRRLAPRGLGRLRGLGRDRDGGGGVGAGGGGGAALAGVAGLAAVLGGARLGIAPHGSCGGRVRGGRVSIGRRLRPDDRRPRRVHGSRGGRGRGVHLEEG